MTRYRVVRAQVHGRDVTPTDHPEQGFPTATEAAQWADAQGLDWRWYVEAYEVTDA